MGFILLSLCAALGWGTADFAGGMASRKIGAYRAVFYGAIVGILVLLVVVAAVGEALPTGSVWIMALIAGLFGTSGVLLLYRAMSVGLMSVAPPISALLSVALPIIVTIFREGLPNQTTIIGLGLALLAIWMISQTGSSSLADIFSQVGNLKLPMLAGVGFGCYFIFIHEASQTSTFWPIIIARTSGLMLITLFMLLRREAWKLQPGAWTLVILNGVLDVSGLTFFVIASQVGRLDIAAVLGSLFPGVTVIMAWMFLREKVSRNQFIGILVALIAIVLMTM